MNKLATIIKPWRRIVALLPDREPATAEAWLATHSGIAVVARDRGGGYGEAAARALPNALQVADRWHLMENASLIRGVIGATAIHPDLLTCVEQIKYDGYLQREDTNAAILALSKSGLPIKRIASQTGCVRQTIRRVVARVLTRLMTRGRDSLSKADTVTIAAIETGLPTLVAAREIIAVPPNAEAQAGRGSHLSKTVLSERHGRNFAHNHLKR
jgi:hypothetical protein